MDFIPAGGDVTTTLLLVLGVTLAVFLLAVVTVVPALTWLISIPARWIAAGRPVLPVGEESRPVELLG